MGRANDGPIPRVVSGGWIALFGERGLNLKCQLLKTPGVFCGHGFAGSLPARGSAGKRGGNGNLHLGSRAKNGAGGDQTYTLKSSGDRQR